MFSGSWWLRTGIFLLSLGALGIPVYQKSVGLGLLHSAITVVLVLGKAAVFSSNRTMKIVHRDYLERKALLYRLIKDLQRHPEMTREEVSRFQREALELIASYVRAHRADFSRTEIFVNLLVEDGDSLVVIARDRDHRMPGARYSRSTMAAAKVFESGDHIVVGNVHREYGDVEKEYRSILVLPVRGRSGISAVVSIDSARAHHFDLEARDLERFLQPYIGLLEWTL
jgi:hypothetical protein